MPRSFFARALAVDLQPAPDLLQLPLARRPGAQRTGTPLVAELFVARRLVAQLDDRVDGPEDIRTSLRPVLDQALSDLGRLALLHAEEPAPQ